MAISKIQLPNDNTVHDIETALTPVLAPGGGANSLVQKGVNTTYPDVKNEADGQNSITLGDMNQNTGVSAVVGGSDNENHASYAFVTGVDNLNNGGAHNSIIAGRWNDNDQKNTLIVGQNNTVNASGQSADYAGGSIIGGHNHVVDGFSTAIFGQKNTNSSNNTLIAGFTNTIGTGADASAILGRNNTIAANAYSSIAIGSLNTINHFQVGVMGRGLQSGASSQILVGKFNATSTDAVFVVGAGSSTTNPRNGLEVKTSGDIVTYRHITAGGTITDGNNYNVAETVKQGRSAGTQYRPLLMHQAQGAYGTNLGTVTGNVHYNETIAACPATGEIRATLFTGALNGKADSAAVADEAGEAARAYVLYDSSMNINFKEGFATQPVYFDNGVPIACTYSLNATVPSNAKFTDTIFTGGNVSSHIYLTGAKENSSTSNTSQIVFGTSSNNHVALSSNTNALVINPDTSSTTNQIVLYLNQQSIFPGGIRPLGTNAVDLGSGSYKWRNVHATTFYGDLAGTARSAEMAQCDEEGNEIHTTYQKKMIRTSIQLTQNPNGTYAVNWSDIEGRELYLAIQYVTDAGDSVGFASSIIIVHTQAYDNVNGDPQCYFDGSLFTIDQNAAKVTRQPRITRTSNSDDICTLSFMTTDHVKDPLLNTEVHMYYR